MSLPWSSKGSKATPVSADELLIIDSQDANPSTTNKRITLGSISFSGITSINTDTTADQTITAGAGLDIIDNLAGDHELSIDNTVVTLADNQFLTNKNLDATNSIAGEAIDTGTLDDAVLSSNVMLLDGTQENTGAKQFQDNTLEFRNLANTFDYHIRTSALTADVDATLPLLTANDIFVFEAHTQSLTNKTINDFSNDVGADDVHVEVRNESGIALAKGDAVYISGIAVAVATLWSIFGWYSYRRLTC